VDKLANLYREADVFCYPSVAEKGEAFGVSALEAMASGLVTVVSDLDCFKDFIENYKTGYIFNHRLKDPDIELSRVLEVALCDCEANKAIVKQAVIKASNFSYERVANSYLEYFSNLLK
jgi:glycosyltransferase involved in cell wall biosynthesis